MTSIILLGLVLGAVLSRFNVFALVPAMCLAMILVAAGGMIRGEGAWHVLTTMAALWLAAPLGYLAASLLLWVGSGGRSRRPADGQARRTRVS